FSAEADSARLAHRLLQEATAAADSLWPQLVTRFAQDAELSLTLSGNYFPESRLFIEQPVLRQHLAQLRPGQLAPLIEANGHTHLLQLEDRVPAGSIPELAWIEDQVQRQLTIDARKQMYERQVQRLRTEALSRDVLVIR
ncbi:MAG: peptidyl-prolyl cis-trans isomerase, partial [Rhodothermales bacterium]